MARGGVFAQGRDGNRTLIDHFRQFNALAKNLTWAFAIQEPSVH